MGNSPAGGGLLLNFRKLLETCGRKFKAYEAAGCETYFNKMTACGRCTNMRPARSAFPKRRRKVIQNNNSNAFFFGQHKLFLNCFTDTRHSAGI